MTIIPRRELRNQISAVLRRAEQGEHFTVTVDGRRVARLGPLAVARKPAAADRLAAVFAQAPVDRAWAGELCELRDADLTVSEDPWTRRPRSSTRACSWRHGPRRSRSREL